MGLTIDEITKTFNYIKHVGNGESEYKHCRQEIALDEAVAIMRKYQKIEDIVRDYYNEQYTDKLDIEIIEMISEVLEEDGRWE